MFALRVSDNIGSDSALARLVASFADLAQRLESRQKVEPDAFAAAMKIREETHHLGEIQFVSI